MPPSQRNDEWIRSEVLRELEQDPALRCAGIKVQVHDGVVSLIGELSEPALRSSAHSAAAKVHGCCSVVDQLVVSNGLEMTDRALEKSIEQELATNALIRDLAISYSVSEGIIRISGTVQREAQREDILRAMHNLAGVRQLFADVTIRG